MWDNPVVLKSYHSLLRNFSDQPRDLARLLAASTKEFSAWLHALPAASLGNLLDNDSLRITLALRLGAPVGTRHKCRCGAVVEETGHRGLCCVKNAEKLSRHNALNEIIWRALVLCNIVAVLEPQGVDRDDGKRPDGLKQVPWKVGKQMVCYATCIDTVSASHLEFSTLKPGLAAKNAEGRKFLTYCSLERFFSLCLLGFETLSSWGTSAVALVSDIGKSFWRLVVTLARSRVRV